MKQGRIHEVLPCLFRRPPRRLRAIVMNLKPFFDNTKGFVFFKLEKALPLVGEGK